MAYAVRPLFARALDGDLPCEIPSKISDCDEEWFTTMLRAQELLGAANSVSAAKHEEIGAGKGFVALTFRCQLTYVTYDDAASKAPSSVIIKLPNMVASVSASKADAVKAVAVEVPFYTQLLPRISNMFERPDCYFAAARKGKAILVLEDMCSSPGAQEYKLYVGDQIQSLDLNEARAMVKCAAAVHAQSWNFVLTAEEKHELKITGATTDFMQGLPNMALVKTAVMHLTKHGMNQKVHERLASQGFDLTEAPLAELKPLYRWLCTIT